MLHLSCLENKNSVYSENFLLDKYSRNFLENICLAF